MIFFPRMFTFFFGFLVFDIIIASNNGTTVLPYPTVSSVPSFEPIHGVPCDPESDHLLYPLVSLEMAMASHKFLFCDQNIRLYMVGACVDQMAFFDPVERKCIVKTVYEGEKQNASVSPSLIIFGKDPMTTTTKGPRIASNSSMAQRIREHFLTTNESGAIGTGLKVQVVEAKMEGRKKPEAERQISKEEPPEGRSKGVPPEGRSKGMPPGKTTTITAEIEPEHKEEKIAVGEGTIEPVEMLEWAEDDPEAEMQQNEQLENVELEGPGSDIKVLIDFGRQNRSKEKPKKVMNNSTSKEPPTKEAGGSDRHNLGKQTQIIEVIPSIVAGGTNENPINLIAPKQIVLCADGSAPFGGNDGRVHRCVPDYGYAPFNAFACPLGYRCERSTAGTGTGTLHQCCPGTGDNPEISSKTGDEEEEAGEAEEMDEEVETEVEEAEAEIHKSGIDGTVTQMMDFRRVCPPSHFMRVNPHNGHPALCALNTEWPPCPPFSKCVYSPRLLQFICCQQNDPRMALREAAIHRAKLAQNRHPPNKAFDTHTHAPIGIYPGQSGCINSGQCEVHFPGAKCRNWMCRCPRPYSAHNGRCVPWCPNGYFDQKGICVPIPIQFQQRPNYVMLWKKK